VYRHGRQGKRARLTLQTMGRLDRYREAARGIPAGETRSFGELAAAVGAPGAARAVGRALGECAVEAEVPWHRVVGSDGALARDPARARVQLERLREEGARPRAGERVSDWAQRVGAPLVGSWRTGRCRRADDAALERQDPTRLEPLRDEAAARARRFVPGGRARPRTVGLPSAVAPTGPVDVAVLATRIESLDWRGIERACLATGLVHLPGVLTAEECRAILRAGACEEAFDRTTHMEAKGYGVGSYRYWKEPLVEPLGTLRAALYDCVRPVAARLEPGASLPTSLAEYHALCRSAEQERPSSILISYADGGVNHPHQDVYGPRCFPLQALVVLSTRGVDFTGGDFVLWREAEDGTREAQEVAADRGDLVLFAARRLADGRRVLHGMRPIESGRRDALGVVWHLAR
jgi:O-6-methylguanine DNA methyltransferase